MISFMTEILTITRSTHSEHLKELKNAGLIQGEINLSCIKYCIDSENREKTSLILTESLHI